MWIVVTYSALRKWMMLFRPTFRNVNSATANATFLPNCFWYFRAKAHDIKNTPPVASSPATFSKKAFCSIPSREMYTKRRRVFQSDNIKEAHRG